MQSCMVEWWFQIHKKAFSTKYQEMEPSQSHCPYHPHPPGLGLLIKQFIASTASGLKVFCISHPPSPSFMFHRVSIRLSTHKLFVFSCYSPILLFYFCFDRVMCCMWSDFAIRSSLCTLALFPAAATAALDGIFDKSNFCACDFDLEAREVFRTS